MFLRTHFIITAFFILIFFKYIQNPLIFLPVVFLAMLIPDIDNRFSKIGHYRLSRIFNFFIKHRGITHSFGFLAIITLLIFLSFKEVWIPFIFGYSLHLLLDSLTLQGIMPFYPLKFRIKGKIKTGGIVENFLFGVFFLTDLFLVFNRIYAAL